MADMSLTQPAIGSTGWGAVVNQNFQDIQDAFLGENSGFDIGPLKLKEDSGVEFLENFTRRGYVSYDTANDRLYIKTEETGSDIYLEAHDKINSSSIYNYTSASTLNMRITNGANIARVTSSRRWKRDIEPLRLGSSVVDVLRPVRFRSACPADDPERVQIGLVAEDVAAVLPELVDCDENGEPQAVDWSAVVAVLIDEVQRLRRDIESLR